MTEKEKAKSEPKIKPDMNVYQRTMMMRADPRLDAVKDTDADAGKYNFDYYSIELLSELTRQVPVDYGLLMWPSRRTIEYQNGSLISCKAEVTMDIINVDKPEERLSLTGYGLGTDNMAAAKALTYASRRAMQYVLGVGSSEDDPERPQTTNDKRKDDMAKLRERANQNSIVEPPIGPSAKESVKPEVPAAPKAEPVKPITPAVPTVPKVAQPTPKAAAITAVPSTAPSTSPFKAVPEYKGNLRGHAIKIYGLGRLGEAAAQEADAMLRKATTLEECDRIAQFIQDNDVDHEAV